MADPIEDLERAVAAVKAEREQLTAGINEVAGGVHRLYGKVPEVLAELNEAKGRLRSIREVVDGFLSEYGGSELPIFKVAQDLANSVRECLDGELEAGD